MFKFASCGIVWLRKRWFGFINWVDNVNWPPWRDSKADVLSVSASWERIKGLTLETSVFKSPYGGQFTLSTQLIKPNYLVILPTNAAPVSLITHPSIETSLKATSLSDLLFASPLPTSVFSCIGNETTRSSPWNNSPRRDRVWCGSTRYL